jgi:hypothetical protein
MSDPRGVDVLVAFLNARLDEDEAAAAASWPGPWDLETEVGGFGPVACVLMPLPGHKGARTGLTSYTPLGHQDADTAAHIARHDPARVLRQVTAMREWITFALVNAASVDGEWGCCHKAGEIAAGLCGYRGDAAARDGLGPLAAIWNDHPDWRQEWAPEERTAPGV